MGKGKKSARTTGDRLITREEWSTFRRNVFDALRTRNGVFPGTIRALAQMLLETHGPRRPFEPSRGNRAPSARIEHRISVLEREGAIRFTWGRSQAYHVVTEIRLVDAAAQVEPPQRFIERGEYTDAEGRGRRRMEVLACLADLGGSAPDITTLLSELIRRYGGHHRQATLAGDVRELEQKRCVCREQRSECGRQRTKLHATERGQRTLAQYRAAHDGIPRSSITTQSVPATPQREAGSRRLRTGQRSLEILRAISYLATTVRPAVTAREISDRLHLTAQRIRVRLCDLAKRELVSRCQLDKGRMAYALTARGANAIGVIPDDAIPATPPDAPVSSPLPATEAPTTGDPPTADASVPQGPPATAPPPAPTRDDIVRLIAETETAMADSEARASDEIARATQIIRERAAVRRESLNERLRKLREALTNIDAIAAQVAEMLAPTAPESTT